MSSACFAHTLSRCTGRTHMSFLLILQEVRPIGKTRNQLKGRRSICQTLSLTDVGPYGEAYASMMPPLFTHSARKQRADAQLHSQS